MEQIEFLSNFLYLVWTVNPDKDRVTLIIDGEQKQIIKREAFLVKLKSVLDITQLSIKDNVTKIELSLVNYGDWFFYDRPKNEFKLLRETVELEKLLPQEIYNKTAENLSFNRSYIDKSSYTRYNEITNNMLTDKKSKLLRAKLRTMGKY